VPSEGPADIWAVAVSAGAARWPDTAAGVAAGLGGAADPARGAEAAGGAGLAGGLISVLHAVFVLAVVSGPATDAPDGRDGAAACD
jgi:hypothetical protein